MKRPTVRDIARICGLSPATVSRVLNRHTTRVGAEARQRVEDAIRQLNYRHSEFDRKAVAVVVSCNDAGDNHLPRFSTDLYTAHIASAVSEVFFREGYRVEVLGFHDLETMALDRFAAVVSCEHTNRFTDSWIAKRTAPLVFIHNLPPPEHEGVYAVGSDENQGMTLAVEHLRANGHKHIGLLLVGAPFMRQCRLAAFQKAVAERGMTGVHQAVPVHTEFFNPLGKLVHAKVSALIVPGEEVGQQVAYALSLYRFGVPEKLSLITWETPRVSDFWMPRLTTVAQDFQAIAERAYAAVAAHARKQPLPREQYVPYRFIERDSVATLA